MKIAIIVAVSENGVIGSKNNLPWNLPDDMKFFKEKTFGSVVIMGRKSWDSIPVRFKPLSNRVNIVLTKNPLTYCEGAQTADSLEQALNIANLHPSLEVFIIGGGETYKEAIKLGVHELYLTRVHIEIEGDVTFLEIDKSKWKIAEETYHPIDEKHKYAFTFLKYVPI